MALFRGNVRVSRNFDYKRIPDEEEKQHVVIRLDNGQVVASGKDKKLRAFSEKDYNHYQLEYTINVGD